MKRTGKPQLADIRTSPNKKLETYKLVFDLMKHITTLSSGSILLLVTLIEKIFGASPPLFLIRVAFGGFGIAIVLAIVAMMLLAMSASDGELTNRERNTFAVSAVFSCVAFAIGIAYTVIAAVPWIK